MLLSFCIKNDNGKEECIDIPTKFTDEEQFMNIADSMYDVVLELANDYLSGNKYSDYHIEMIETNKEIKDKYEGTREIWDLSHLDEFGWSRK